MKNNLYYLHTRLASLPKTIEIVIEKTVQTICLADILKNNIWKTVSEE
jgi:hypothetical protein